MHLYIVLYSYILLHTRPRSTSISSASGMQERAETLLKAMKVEKSLLEVPRWQRFCWNVVLFGEVGRLGNRMKQKVRWKFILSFDEILSVIYIYTYIYIDTLDGDDIIPYDARQIILRAFFIWRSMMNFHYPLISLDNFCILGGGFAEDSQRQGLHFSTEHHAKLASVHLHDCTLQGNARTGDAVKSFVCSYWEQPQKTNGIGEFWIFPVRTMHSTGAVKHGTDSSSNRQRGAGFRRMAGTSRCGNETFTP